MQDERDALLVVGDGEAIGAVAVDTERLLRQHAALINGVHVADEQDLLATGAGKGRAHHAPDALGRVLHAIDVARLDQFDIAAQGLEPRRDQVGQAVKAFVITTAGFDRNQRGQRVEQRRPLLTGLCQDRFDRLR
jgi:hypothetical protein